MTEIFIASVLIIATVLRMVSIVGMVGRTVTREYANSDVLGDVLLIVAVVALTFVN